MKGDVTMKVMTFNIQHALDYKKQVIDYDLFVKAIAEQNPDFCGLNEVRGRGWLKGYANQTKKLADGLGYNGYFGKAVTLDFGNPFGNALVCRYPLKSVETVIVPDPPKTEKATTKHVLSLKLLSRLTVRIFCSSLRIWVLYSVSVLIL